EQQVLESRQKLEDAEFQLMDFSNNEGVVSAALERDIALQKLSEADATARQARIAIAETVQRIRMLESDLHSLPERTTTVMRNADNPQLLEKMKSKLLELELKRTELLAKYEPTYRLVLEVNQQIAEAKASVAAEEQAPLRDQTTEPDPNHGWAKAELMKAQVELTGLEARALETAKLVTNYQQSAKRLGDHAIEQARLLQNLKGAEERYVLYTNKREEARIGDALDQGGVLNVTIAERPRAPALPVRSAWNFGLWGIVLGGTFSTGLALLPIGWIRRFEPQTKWWLFWEHGFWRRFPRGTRRGGAALPKLGRGPRRLSTSVRNTKVFWRTHVNQFCGTTSPDACTRGISTRPSASHGSSVGSRSVSRRTGAQFSSASISSRLAASGAAGGLLRSG